MVPIYGIPPYIAMDTMGIIILALLYLNHRRQRADGLRTQRTFNALLLCVTVLLLLDACTWALDINPAARNANIVCCFFYYALSPICCVLWLVYVEHWISGSARCPRAKLYTYCAIALLEIALLIANLWTEWLYCVSDRGVYTRGEFFWEISLLLYAFLGYACFLALRQSLRETDADKRRQCQYIAFFMLFPVIGSILQGIFYGVSLVWPFASLSLLMVYLNVQQRRIATQRIQMLQQAQAAAELESQLTQSRVSIMLSQIQPHFLYNALNTIRFLCDTDPESAGHVVENFAKFLRGNMDSLQQPRPIPFSRELSHVLSYLEIEKYRFPDVEVSLDIQTDAFSLPALSVQPLVENAIRYGVTKQEGGGKVTISTQETPTGYVVRVTDDGVGFDPYRTQTDGRSHIGIQNTTNRIAALCDGTLTVNSRPGKGTTATIFIPKGVSHARNRN